MVVRALLAGEQILDLRKGGINEEGRHFALRATRVWLYPTVEHQERDLVRPAYQRWIDDSERDAPPERAIRVEGWADVVGVAKLTEPDDLAKIDGKFVWTPEYAASRLSWKQRDALWVLALRAHRLDRADHGPVPRRVRRLHVVGRSRRAPRRPRVASRRSPR